MSVQNVVLTIAANTDAGERLEQSSVIPVGSAVVVLWAAGQLKMYVAAENAVAAAIENITKNQVVDYPPTSP